MKIETKFEIGQTVYCLIGYGDNTIHTTKIVAVFTKNFAINEDLDTINYRIVDEWGYSHTIPEEQVFSTKEEAEAKLKELE